MNKSICTTVKNRRTEEKNGQEELEMMQLGGEFLDQAQFRIEFLA